MRRSFSAPVAEQHISACKSRHTECDQVRRSPVRFPLHHPRSLAAISIVFLASFAAAAGIAAILGVGQ